MCGILGLIANSFEQEKYLEGLNALVHRGPDNEDFVHEQILGKSVFLGHTRLSIIDLSTSGNQPITEDNVTISYNGEVYNFQKIKDSEFSETSFRSKTDTEVILKLYLRYGPSFVSKLNGDFAISILDRNLKKVFLFRDRMGVKPLYLYRSNGLFSFASEIKAFKKMGLPLSFKAEGLGKFLVFKYSPGQETLFNEVERLAPASVFEYNIQDGVFGAHKYWRLNNEPTFTGNYADAKNELTNILGNSINSRLIGDVPIANYLSGGLDSSIIAHYLKGSDHTHYCAVKNIKDLNKEGTSSDGLYASKLAQEWRLKFEKINIGINQLSKESIRRAIWACDDAIADGSIIPAMLIAEKASLNYKVVLSGMGADELFMGYNGHYLIQLDSMLDSVPTVAGILRKSFSNLQPGRGALKAYKRYLKKWADNSNGKFTAARFSVVGDVDSAMRLSKNFIAEEEIFGEFIGQSNGYGGLMNFELDNFLVKNLHYLDRSSMAFGLESRVPFLDHHLVEFAAALPQNWKMNWQFKSKRILKDAYKNIVPRYVTNRRKAGFGMPLRSLLANPNVLNELLDLEFLADLDLFNVDCAKKLILNHKSGIQDQSALIYSLIIFQEWYKAFFVEDVKANAAPISLITN